MCINNRGNIDDIRIALGYINPKTDLEKHVDIAYLETSIDSEQMREMPRQTVIKLINAKIKKLEKLKYEKSISKSY